jgi:hypothetical protein
VRESQRENPIGILLVDVRLSSAFPIIGSTHMLNNRTVGIGYFPNLLLDDPRKATNETVDVSDLFHLSFSLSFYCAFILHYLSAMSRGYLEEI